MKVQIEYNEIQYLRNTIEVEMTNKEYKEYLKMSEWDKEQKYQLTARTSVEDGHWVETQVLPIKTKILD
jgi:nuclear transport factor 2 (NTF2) superfamily protein